MSLLEIPYEPEGRATGQGRGQQEYGRETLPSTIASRHTEYFTMKETKKTTETEGSLIFLLEDPEQTNLAMFPSVLPLDYIPFIFNHTFTRLPSLHFFIKCNHKSSFLCVVEYSLLKAFISHKI